MTSRFTCFRFLAWTITGFFLALALPSGARASPLFLKYEAYWGGLHIADFTLSLLASSGHFENRFHLESRGLTRYFTNLSAIATSRGRIVTPPPASPAYETVSNAADLPQADTYIAQSYRTEYTNTKHLRWVDISFGAPGEAAKAITGTKPTPGFEDNWDPKDKGPEVLEKVDAKFRTGVNDPISLVPQIMAIVRAHLKGGMDSGIARGFDGRRRFDMRVQDLGPAQRTIAGVVTKTYRVRVIPTPVAGFKNRQKTLWNNAAYDFYLSRDERLVPLQIVPVNHGPVLTLTARCAQECPLSAQE